MSAEIAADPSDSGFPLLVTGGAYLGRGRTDDRRTVLVFVFPAQDSTNAARVSINVERGEANTRDAIPNSSVWRFVTAHLRMFDVDDTSFLEWKANPTWAHPVPKRRMASTKPRRQKARKRKALPSGRIYFLEDEQHFVKIGFTTNLEARVSTLRTASRQRLALLGAIDGSMTDETALHKRFAHLRVHGEWFEPAPELRSFLAEQVSA